MAVGLGSANDPFARRRAEAAEAYLPKNPPPPDDDDEGPDLGKPENNLASTSASNSASNPTAAGGGVSDEDVSGTEPAPPPSREPTARVQFNQRMRSDYRKVLDRYRRQHGATWQGVFDQMVEEYLERRGLLPRRPDEPT
jgi:hypothetical protein